MPQDPPAITLTIPSDLRMVAPARTFLEAVCQTYQIERPTMHAILLATAEALTNVIRHAHRDRPLAQIHLQVQIRPGLAVIDLLDEGEPFDLDAVPHMEPGELRIGGRGVFLMRALMDELCCLPQSGGNLLRMVKRWPTDAASQKCG